MLSTTEEIKQRLDIVDLISEYIQLKPAGANFRALCPFHNEKTPSLMVSPERQIWHCFGCGKGGDHFAFIKEIEGIEFIEALRILADKAGVKIQFREPKYQTTRNILWQLNQELADFWQKNLWEKKDNQPIRDYLKERKLNNETLKFFQIGYASADWHEAVNFLKSRGYRDKEILQAGVAQAGDQRQELFDRFRNRIIFPINDLQGNIVGFGGRIFDQGEKTEEAKYLNSPQTEVYNKSRVLYGLSSAKVEIKKKDYVIIVEGYLDLISAYQAGTSNVVASSGTALTTDQLKILKRLTNNIMICFDMDEAGVRASQRGIDLVLASEFNVKVIILDNYKDPDECIRKDPQQWFAAIRQARHFVDFYIDRVLKNYDLTRPDHKKKAAALILEQISRLPNLIEQTHYLQKLSKLINVAEDILRQVLAKKISQKKFPPAASEPTPFKSIDKKLLITQRLLALIFQHPGYLKVLIDNLEPAIFGPGIYQDLYKLLVNYYNLNQQLTINEFLSSLTDIILINEVNTLCLLADSEFIDWTENQLSQEIINNINFLKKDHYTNRLKELSEAIKLSEQEKNSEQLKSLTSEFNQLAKSLKDL